MGYTNDMSYVNNMSFVCRLYEFYELSKSYEYFYINSLTNDSRITNSSFTIKSREDISKNLSNKVRKIIYSLHRAKRKLLQNYKTIL